MEKFKNKLKDHGGFTLIEMLIVVAIIAILIAIGIPMVNAALENAREATDSANERAALGLAMTDVLANNKMADATADADGKLTAFYVIDKEKKGMLKATWPAGTDAYGKSTKLGEMPNHVDGVVRVTYDPTATDEVNQFKAEWVKTDGSALS